jgi:hypothetical protein
MRIVANNVFPILVLILCSVNFRCHTSSDAFVHVLEGASLLGEFVILSHICAWLRRRQRTYWPGGPVPARDMRTLRGTVVNIVHARWTNGAVFADVAV